MKKHASILVTRLLVVFLVAYSLFSISSCDFFTSDGDPYACPDYFTIPASYSSDSIQVPIVCNQLIVSSTHDDYDFWEGRLTAANFAMIESCNCADGLELWEYTLVGDFDLAGIIEDPEKDAGAIGGGGNPIYNTIHTYPESEIFITSTTYPQVENLIPNSCASPAAAVKIAVVDTGIDVNPDPAANVLLGWNWQQTALNEVCVGLPPVPDFGWNVTEAGAEPVDDNGHGTHVTGIIAQDDSGIAFEFMHVKFTDEDSNSGTLFDGLCGLYYALEQGADIINVSFGYLSDKDAPAPIQNFIETAEEQDVLIIAGTGNDSLRLRSNLHFYPASFAQEFDNVISVGAIRSEDDPERWEGSNWATDGQMTLLAPGVNIVSAFPRNLTPPDEATGLALMSGTSMATPRVTRTAAVLRGLNPDWKSAKIKSLLIATSNEHADYLILDESTGAETACFLQQKNRQ